MLSLPQLNDICLLYGGSKQCRYLDGDENDYNKYYCKKQSPDAKHIDDLTEEYITEAKSEGRDPELGNVPLGDNCNGFLPFKDILQGYDV